MTAWERIKAIKEEERALKSSLESIGWALLETDGVWTRARKKGGRRDTWNEIKTRRPKDLLEAIGKEIERVEKEKNRR